MAVIDFHTHILPELDDGSKNPDTSAAMYEESAKQGVDVIVATPHFYANHDTIEHFIKARQIAYDKVKHMVTEGKPSILLGAEVAWFDGISRADKIDLLTIENTNVLLLELPFRSWDSAMLHELKQMTDKYCIVLAHLERYLKIPGNKKALAFLKELPLYVQINAGSLTDWRERRTLVKMFRTGQAHFLGSDCHGIHHRVPNLADGREILRKKLGTEFIEQMDERGEALCLKRRQL